MQLEYKLIEIYTSETARWQGRPMHDAVVDYIARSGVAARSIVARGQGGSYEDGEIASTNIEVLMYNMPVKIEIIVPAVELKTLLPSLEEMLTDGILVVRDLPVMIHRAQKRLIPRWVKVKDAMTSSPKSVREETPVSEVVQILLAHDFNGVPVLNADDEPVGIITQDDLITRAQMPVRLGLLGEFACDMVDEWRESLSHIPAREVMTSPVVVIEADKHLHQAVDMMLDRRLKRLPVVENGKLVGMLSRLDIFRSIGTEAKDWSKLSGRNVVVENARYVRDIMRRDTHTVFPNTPIAEIVRTIDTTDIQRVAVVDVDGRLLGMISDRDLLLEFSEHHASIWDQLLSHVPFSEISKRHKEIVDHAKARTAADVMKTDLVTVNEDTPVEDAVRLMVEKQIKRLPVVDSKESFKGMVSRDSVLRLCLPT